MLLLKVRVFGNYYRSQFPSCSLLCSMAFLLQNVAYAARSGSYSKPMPFAMQCHTCLNLQWDYYNKTLILNITKRFAEVTVSQNFETGGETSRCWTGKVCSETSSNHENTLYKFTTTTVSTVLYIVLSNRLETSDGFSRTFYIISCTAYRTGRSSGGCL